MVRNELVHTHGQETTVGFEVYPLEVKAKRKPKAKAKPVKAKGAVGRPRVYNGTHRRQVAAALKKHGLTKGLVYLAKEKKLKVSLTLARSVAAEYGIKFQLGRPAA